MNKITIILEARKEFDEKFLGFIKSEHDLIRHKEIKDFLIDKIDEAIVQTSTGRGYIIHEIYGETGQTTAEGRVLYWAKVLLNES